MNGRQISDALLAAVYVMLGWVLLLLGLLGVLVELLTDAQWQRDPLLLAFGGMLFLHLAHRD